MLDAISKEAAQALAVAFVDELFLKYPPELIERIGSTLIDELIAKAKEAAVGRTVTIG